MIYVIDHQDSFTYNLVHLLESFDDVYVSNFFNIDKNYLKKSNLIVFSPGPGQQKDYSQSSLIYNKWKGRKKILGICLGFQLIMFNENSKIVQQNKIYHGHQSKIEVLKECELFLKDKFFTVGRYHSLKIQEPISSKNIKITMRCAKTNVAMAIEDNINKIYGFQFHPESFLTKNGKYLIQKVLSA